MKDRMGVAGSAPDISNKNPKIIVMRSGAIGDTLMVTPALRALRKSFPHAFIAALTSQPALDILRFNPHIDEVLPIKNRHLPIWLSADKGSLIRHFRRWQPDLVLSLETSNVFTGLASRFRPKRIITYDPSARYDDLEYIEPAVGEHSSATHLRAAKAAGAEPAGSKMEFYYPPELDRTVYEHLKLFGVHRSDKILGVHAGWGSRRQDPEETRLRSWPIDRFAEIIRWAHERFGSKIVLTGSPIDRPLNQLIGTRAGVPFINTAGTFSLLESAALIRRMGLYLTVDSGPAHLAAALGAPLITLWGPGIFTATAPLAGDGALRILHSPPPCAPCYGTTHMKTCIDNICMKQIAVDDVKRAVRDLFS